MDEGQESKKEILVLDTHKICRVAGWWEKNKRRRPDRWHSFPQPQQPLCLHHAQNHSHHSHSAGTERREKHSDQQAEGLILQYCSVLRVTQDLYLLCSSRQDFGGNNSRKHAMQACYTGCVCVCVCTDSPWLHAVLQSLQTGLNEVKRLEKQRGAGPAEWATHEGFNSWMGLGDEDRNQIWSE